MLSRMLHGSETRPVRKENEVVFKWAEIRKVRWMCDIMVKIEFQVKELRWSLGIDDVISVLQENRL